MAVVILVAAANGSVGIGIGNLVIVAVDGEPAGVNIVVAAVKAVAVVMLVQTHNLFTVAVDKCSML